MASNDISKLDFKAGDVLKADDVMAIVDAIRNPTARFIGGANIHGMQGSDGSLSLSVPTKDIYLATATGMAARSGTTMDAGTATAFVNIDGTATATAMGGIPVVNPSPSAIASGDYVLIVEGSDGTYYALPLAGAASDGFCRLGSSLGPATGTWPSITPTSQASVTIYQGGSGGISSIGSFTVYNFRQVTWATGKTTYVTSAGGAWKVIDQDC